MNAIVPLWAAIDSGQLIGFLFVIAVVFLRVILPILAKMNKMKPPGGVMPPPQPPKPNPNDPVASEVDEFLRRAAERRNNKGIQPVVVQPKPVRPPVVAEVVQEKPIGVQVGEHVKKYLDEEEFDRRSAQLGAEVAQVDSEINQHLHKTFDHTVSKLATVPGIAAIAPTAIEPVELAEIIPDASATSAGSLFALLADPDSVRQAIVLNEILHRPEERWG